MQNMLCDYINDLPLILPLPSQHEQTITGVNHSDNRDHYHLYQQLKKKKKDLSQYNNNLHYILTHYVYIKRI